MFWSLSFQLMPGESIREDSTGQDTGGIKPTYSVFLTNKRVIFRFDGLGSTMAQSFLYPEITAADPAQRMFITYLRLQTQRKEHFLHIPEPGYWAAKILGYRNGASPPAPAMQPLSDPIAQRKKQELIDMLDALQRQGILTADEHDQKKRLVDALQP